MKNKQIRIIFLCITVLFCSYQMEFICSASEKKPVIFVPQDTFEFPTVPAGQMVLHDFIVQNNGDAPLLIEEVEPDCGCTAVDFSKQIPPNGKGKVTVKLNTIDYGGNFITKYVEIFSNDPKKPVTNLIIKGTVDKFIEETEPLFARLKGIAGEKMETEATITPSIKYPFKIIDLKTQKKENIDVVLKQSKEKTGSIKHILKIENVRKTPGHYHDIISVRTDSPVRPELKIFVFGDIGASK